MNYIKRTPQIWSIDKLLDANLIIPDYQRPYKWTKGNIEELLTDFDVAIVKQTEFSNLKFKYRVGTILLHNNTEDKTLDIIDGQQRIVSFFLLKKGLLLYHFDYIYIFYPYKN